MKKNNLSFKFVSYLVIIFCIVIVFQIQSCKDEDTQASIDKSTYWSNLVKEQREKYTDFINSGVISFLPDDPREATPAQLADAKNFWGIEYGKIDEHFSDTDVDYTDASSPVSDVKERTGLNYQMNFLRYVVQTRAFAENLKKYVPIEGDTLIDYREMLILARKTAYKLDFEHLPEPTSLWRGSLGKRQFKIALSTDNKDIKIPESITPSLSVIKATQISEKWLGLFIDDDKHPNYTLGYSISGVLLHEIFHNHGFDHYYDIVKSTQAIFEKNKIVYADESVEILDVAVVLQYVLQEIILTNGGKGITKDDYPQYYK